jgi:glycerol-3-phosphate acyltransferase PlsY
MLFPITGSTILTSAMALITVMLYWRHRSNIENLLAGREDKIGSKK